MSNDPKDPPPPAPQDLFPFDEMSTGETSSLLRRANAVTGQRERSHATTDPTLKPMTGAQLAFRPSAPPRPATGTQATHKPGTAPNAAFKPTTGVQPAFTPTTGTHAAIRRPVTGAQPAFKPASSAAVGRSSTGTNTFATFKPTPPREEQVEVEEESPIFDPEKLQAQIRALSLTDSALGRAVKASKPNKAPTSSVEDTFVKTKMKQAEAKMPDFDLDEDLG